MSVIRVDYEVDGDVFTEDDLVKQDAIQKALLLNAKEADTIVFNMIRKDGNIWSFRKRGASKAKTVMVGDFVINANDGVSVTHEGLLIVNGVVR